MTEKHVIKSRKSPPPYIPRLISSTRKKKWQTTLKISDDHGYNTDTVSLSLNQPPCHVGDGVPITWAASERVRARCPPKSPPAPSRPRTRARAPPPHVGASPSPLQPPPPAHPLSGLGSESGFQTDPGSLLLLPSPSSESGPDHVP